MKSFLIRIVMAVVLIAAPQLVIAAEDQAIDDAIVKALRYLAQQQRPNGCWVVDQIGDSTAATSLSIMSFLASGHVPGEGAYGQAIDKGVKYVLDHQHKDGLLVDRHSHGPMYDHGISALMLSEVAGMMPKDQSERVRKALERSITLILAAQRVKKNPREAGGWRYQQTSLDSDLSVTAWQLLALRAAKDIGCDVPIENIDLAVGYIKRCVNGAGFSYQPGGGPSTTLTPAGVLALQVCDHFGDFEVLNGIRFQQQHPLRYDDSWFFYGAYYSAISAYKSGGADWDRMKTHLFREILSNQEPQGSWLARNGNERGHGAVYATSMSVLALTVEYGYLPIYQR